MTTPRRLKGYDEISESDWDSLVDAIIELQQGPRVAAPLVVKDGVICLADEFNIYDAVTTSTIAAYGSNQMGSGTAKLRVHNAAGKLEDAQGYNVRTVWNENGNSIPSGIRIKIYFKRGLWRVFNADTCSGVA